MKFADLLLSLRGATSGETILRAAAAASGTLTLPAGTTDFSSSGGAGQVLKQTSIGAPFTVGQLTGSELAAGAAATNVGALSGDLTGTLPSPTVAGLQTRAVATTAPQDTQVLAWSATNNRWQPAAAATGGGGGTITGVTAGIGMSGGGTSGTVTLDLTSPVAIANGGTNATTAIAALSNLGGAPLASPTFTGTPAAPNPAPGTNTTQLATTAFVTISFAPIVSPTFTGTPAAPTAVAGTNTTQLATTAFVLGQGFITGGPYAPLASPTFTGVPAGPTAAPGTSTTQLATTAFVAVSFAPLASPALTGNPTATTQLTADNSTRIATTAYVQAQGYATSGAVAATYAPLASPALTGTPTAPTAAVATNTTQLATTAYVKSQNYLTSNQTVTLSGDVTGSGATAITATLANSGVTAGTYNNVTVNAKGLATVGSNVAYLTGNQTITLSGDITGSGTTAITATLPNVNANIGTFQGLSVNAKGQVIAAVNQNYAPLASPAFTGTPSLPTGTTGVTQTAGNNSTALATTAFVVGRTPVPLTVPLGGTGATNLPVPSIFSGGAVLFGHGTGPVTSADWGSFNDGGLAGYNAGAAPYIDLAAANGTPAAPTALLSGNPLGYVFFDGYGATGWSSSSPAWIQATAAENWTDTAHGAHIDFQTTAPGTTNINERMRIGQGVMIGTTVDPGAGNLTVGGTITTHNPGASDPFAIQVDAGFYARTTYTVGPAGAGQHVWKIGAAPTGECLISDEIVPAVRMKIGTAGGIVIGAPVGDDKGSGTINAVQIWANGVQLTSDARLKTAIAPLPDQCLPLVAAIAPKTFKHLSPPATLPEIGGYPSSGGPPGYYDRTYWGFIADDVAAVMDTAGHDFGGHITDSETGVQSLSYNDMIAVLWKGVQELAARVETLERKLEAA